MPKEFITMGLELGFEVKRHNGSLDSVSIVGAYCFSDALKILTTLPEGYDRANLIYIGSE